MGAVKLFNGGLSVGSSANTYRGTVDVYSKVLSGINENSQRDGSVKNASIATQSGFATDTYLVGSEVRIPTHGLQQKSFIKWTIVGSKTAAGTASPFFNIRVGHNRNINDALGFGTNTVAQTAIADRGVWTIIMYVTSLNRPLNFQANFISYWKHAGTAANTTTQGTGFANNANGYFETIGNIFTAPGIPEPGMYLGLSINAGASAVWTINQVIVEANF